MCSITVFFSSSSISCCKLRFDSALLPRLRYDFIQSRRSNVLRVRTDQFGWWAYVLNSMVSVYLFAGSTSQSSATDTHLHATRPYQSAEHKMQNASPIPTCRVFRFHVIIEYWIRNNAFSRDVCPEIPNGMRHRQFRIRAGEFETAKQERRGEGGAIWRIRTRNENESNGVSVYLSVPNANAECKDVACCVGLRHCRRRTRKIMLCTHNLSVFIFIFILLVTTYRTLALHKVLLAR